MILTFALWVRITGFFPWAERLALHVLPIVLSLRTVVPLLVWATGLMGVFFHMLYALQGGSANARESFTVGSVFYLFVLGDPQGL